MIYPVRQEMIALQNPSYDFTSFIDRRGQDADAVDDVKGVMEGYDIIPMWVADMSFPTAPPVLDAVRSRLEKPHFGYFSPRDEWYDSIIRWHKSRNKIKYKKQYISYISSVLGAMVACYEAFTNPGDYIMTHKPRYTGYSTIEGCGRRSLFTDLKRDEKGIWRMDFDDIESQIIRNHVRVFALCSSHNPTGRVWEKRELQNLVDICRRHGTIIVSDEIWSDITLKGSAHTPILALDGADEIAAALYSVTKTFSLAGIRGAYSVIPNPDIRTKINSVLNKTMLNMMNTLSMYAMIGAYSEAGEEWLNQLLDVLTENVSIAYDRLSAHSGITLMKPEGTYLLYPYVGEWEKSRGVDHETLIRRGVERGVIWINGDGFGVPDTIRINAAVPKSKVIEAFDRLDEYAFV